MQFVSLGELHNWVSVLSLLSLHSLDKYLLIEYPLPARHCSRHWEYMVNKTKTLFSWSADFRRGRPTMDNEPPNKKISKRASARWKIKQPDNMESDRRKHLWLGSQRSLRGEDLWGEFCMPEKASQVKTGRKQISWPKHTPIDFPSNAFFSLFFFPTQDNFLNCKGVKVSSY